MLLIPRRYHYFSHELNREVKELYWNTGLFNLAINLAYIFEPIYLITLGYSVVDIMYFYLMVYVAYALFVIPITKVTSIIGYKHAMLYAAIFQITYWLTLYGIESEPLLFYVAPILFAFQKSLFWPPYNADVALNNVKIQRVREVGVLFSVIEFAAILGPILGGFISYQFGFLILFVCAATLTVISVYPLFLSPEIYTRHEFRFKNFWRIFRLYPRNFFGYWGYAEDLMLMTLWPIFIFTIVPKFSSIGIIVTFASVIAVMLMLYLGRILDRYQKLNLLPTAAVFYGLTWVFRIFANSFSGVVIFDVLTRVGKAFIGVPLLHRTFQIAGARGPDFAIAYGVFFEFSLAIGKVVTALLAIWILTSNGSIIEVFIAVGALTMLYSLIKK